MTRLHHGVLAGLLLVACRADVTPPGHHARLTAPPILGPSFSGTATSSRTLMKPDRSKRSPILQDVAYALGPAEKMDGAVSWLIRDPASRDPLLAVLAKEGLTDHMYVIARHLMLRDVESHPVVNGRRVIKLYRDQHVVIEEDGVSRTAWTRLSLGNVSSDIAPDMLRRYDAGRPIDVAGLGRVRVVHEPTRNVK